MGGVLEPERPGLREGGGLGLERPGLREGRLSRAGASRSPGRPAASGWSVPVSGKAGGLGLERPGLREGGGLGLTQYLP